MRHFKVFFRIHPRATSGEPHCAYIEAETEADAAAKVEACISANAAVALRDDFRLERVRGEILSLQDWFDLLRKDKSRGPLRVKGGGYETV